MDHIYTALASIVSLLDEYKTAPSGVIYMSLNSRSSNRVTLDEYNGILHVLTKMGIIEVISHELHFLNPQEGKGAELVKKVREIFAKQVAKAAKAEMN